MSLKDQLERLKQSRRAMHTGVKERVRFEDTEDMDDETILELVPIPTAYTAPRSLFFDRQRQSPEQEAKFNRKFSRFLRELVVHGERKDIGYLFDYLVRRYMCDTFNAADTIFFLLPFKRYYGQVRHISGRSDFNYFVMQPSHSHQFIGNLCLREKCFFDFFVEYFEYFGHIREFCLGVLGHIVSGLRGTSKDFSAQLFEILSHLAKAGESNAAAELFFEIRDYVGESVGEFAEVLQPFFSREYLMAAAAGDTRPRIEIPLEESAFFEGIYNSGQDREILKDHGRCKSYVMWLHREGRAPKSIEGVEFEALKVLCGVEEKEIEGGICDYVKLLSELGDKRGLIEILSRRFPKDVDAMIPHIGDGDRAYLCGLSPGLWRALMTEENHAVAVMSMPRRIVRAELRDIMRVCLGYVKYDASAFVEHLDGELVGTLACERMEDVFAKNVVETAKQMGFDLTPIIVQQALYTNPTYLNYLSEEPRGLGEEMDRRIFERNMEFSGMGHMDALCRYLRQIKDEVLVNDIVGWLVDKMWLRPIFYSGISMHLEALDAWNCKRILDARGFGKENYPILDKLYGCKECVVDECLSEKHYDALLSLCRKYGFSKVLGGREDGHVVDFVDVASRKELSNKEMDDFVRYSSSLVALGNERVIEALLQNKFAPHLIKCSRLKEWELMKIILSESVLKTNQHRQFCFDYFLSNHADFSNDIDLLEVLVGKETIIDNQKLMEVFRSSDSHFRSGLGDVLVRNSSFDSLRFVPMMVPSMIEHKKESLGMLFERHGNIMGIYVRDVLLEFPELESRILGIDPRQLLMGSIKAYRLSPSSRHLDFMRKVLELPGVAACPETLEQVMRFLNLDVPLAENALLVGFFRVYLKTCSEVGEGIQGLLGTIYQKNRAAFFEISKASLSLCHGLFKPYVDTMVRMVGQRDKDAITFIAAYLHCDPEADVPHRELFEMLLEFYCCDPDTVYAACIGSILKHNPSEIEDANDLMLGHMKGDKVVMILELLQMLYQKIPQFKRCLVKSSPYFALVVDSTRKDVSSAARKLLGIIEKKHSRSGYQLLQL